MLTLKCLDENASIALQLESMKKEKDIVQKKKFNTELKQL